MPIHPKDLVEINFDRTAYSQEWPLGIWKAKINQAVYSNGSKMGAWQKGKHTGINLYVQHENGWKIWLFVPLLPGLGSFAAAAELNSGDLIEVEIASSNSELSVVKSLQKIQLPKR